MDRGNESDIRCQPAHAAYLSVIVGASLPVIIVALNICSCPIFAVFSAFEELNDFIHILEPFVIVQVKKPFSFCFYKTGVSCF